MSEPYHSRYIDVADTVGRELQFFCIVRNPWSRTASRYVFARQNSEQWPATDPRRRYIAEATFEDFVRDRKVFDIPEHPGQPWMGPMNSWFNQLEWIQDEQKRVVCDCLRLEKLDHDLQRYLGAAPGVPRHNVTRIDYDYRQMYTGDLADLVAKEFSEDIDYFGFTFDGPATRNIAIPS